MESPEQTREREVKEKEAADKEAAEKAKASPQQQPPQQAQQKSAEQPAAKPGDSQRAERVRSAEQILTDDELIERTADADRFITKLQGRLLEGTLTDPELSELFTQLPQFGAARNQGDTIKQRVTSKLSDLKQALADSKRDIHRMNAEAKQDIHITINKLERMSSGRNPASA